MPGRVLEAMPLLALHRRAVLLPALHSSLHCSRNPRSTFQEFISSWGSKKLINFFNINILSTTPFWAPRKKLMCLISLESTQKRDPHKLLWGHSWGQTGCPKRAIFGHKKFSFLFFSLLIQHPVREGQSMDRYRCRPELSERSGSHWSI